MAITRPRRAGDEPSAGSGPPQLYNLVYCSRAAAGVDDNAVHAILHTAHRRNPAEGITGLLVFGSGIFFQWLEGPRDNVATLFGHIQADARHHHVVLLSESEEPRERLFPDWAMELVTAEHIRDVLQDALDSAPDASSAATLAHLLAELDGGALAAL